MMMNYDENNVNNAADDSDNNDGDDAIKMHMFYFIVAPDIIRCRKSWQMSAVLGTMF